MNDRQRAQAKAPAPRGEPPYQLNLGAAKTYIPGFINIDIDEKAELSLDLGTERLPFPDDSVRRIVSHHTLEHVPDYLFALGEIHRVLMHDGELLLSLPYATLTEHHLVNPYHHHNFNEHSFDFFDPAILKGSAAEESEIAFRKALVRFSYIGYFGALPRPARVWARRHLLNVVKQFDIALVAIKDPGRAVDLGPARVRDLERSIVELKRMRTRYVAGARAAGDDTPRRRRAPAGRARKALRARRGALERHWENRHD
jgi:SAM-dependent methyltransferase